MRNIGGTLDLAALSRLAGDPDADRLRHFATLDLQQQTQTIKRLASIGWMDSRIAAATRLSVEQVRRILGGTGPVMLESERC